MFRLENRGGGFREWMLDSFGYPSAVLVSTAVTVLVIGLVLLLARWALRKKIAKT